MFACGGPDANVPLRTRKLKLIFLADQCPSPCCGAAGMQGQRRARRRPAPCGLFCWTVSVRFRV